MKDLKLAWKFDTGIPRGRMHDLPRHPKHAKHQSQRRPAAHPRRRPGVPRLGTGEHAGQHDEVAEGSAGGDLKMAMPNAGDSDTVGTFTAPSRCSV